MKQENKLWPLEVCRGLAAIYVVLHHSRQMLPHAIQPFLLFGQEAVILFFLLSGFVIHYNYSVKSSFDRADFLWKRFVRIYPIFILVMLLSIVLNLATGARQEHMDTATFFYNIVGLQDSQLQKPGIGYATFGDNDPLWSLGYEAWFYVFYAIVGSAGFKRNLLIVTLVSFASALLFSFYPGKAYLTLLYLPIWWLGAAIAESTLTERTRPFLWGMLVLLIAMSGYVAGSFEQIKSSGNSIGLHPFIEIRHFSAAIVFAVLWMMAQKWLSMKHFLWMEPLAVLAPISYGIYIVHVPLLRAVKFVLHDGIVAWSVFIVLTLIMAYLLEIVFQKKIVLPLLLKRKKYKSTGMKILFITPSYKPAYIYGGPIVVIARLAERLVQLGHEVTVYTTAANGKGELDVPLKEPVMMDGVTVRYFKRITGDHTHISPSLYAYTWATAKQYDVVHIHSWWNFAVLGAALIFRLRGIKPVLSPHGMFCDYVLHANNKAKKKFIHAVIGKPLLKQTYLHVSSQIEWNECLEINKDWKGANIFNLVDLPSGEYKRDERPVFTISFLSRIDPKKGLDILINALSGVSFPYRLQIAGSGNEDYVQQLKKMVSDHGMEEHVEWVGWMNTEQKFPFLAGSDLFALTSLNENFAIVVIESLYVGTPVLISNNVGLSNYVEKNGFGWITGIERVEEIREKLTEAYNKREERNEITSRARKIIDYDFNEAKLAGDYVKLYESTNR